MKHVRIFLYGVSLFSILCALPANAEKGFKLGIDFPLVSFPFGDVKFNPALGLGLRIGYGIDDKLSLARRRSSQPHNQGGIHIY